MFKEMKSFEFSSFSNLITVTVAAVAKSLGMYGCMVLMLSCCREDTVKTKGNTQFTV